MRACFKIVNFNTFFPFPFPPLLPSPPSLLISQRSTSASFQNNLLDFWGFEFPEEHHKTSPNLMMLDLKDRRVWDGKTTASC